MSPFKGPNCAAPSEAPGAVLPICIHNFALLFPKRAFHNITASGSTKTGSVPDFSSLLIFNWKEQIPSLFFSILYIYLLMAIEGSPNPWEYVDRTFRSLSRSRLLHMKDSRLTESVNRSINNYMN